MEITLELPERLIIKLKKLSRVKEKTLEELISEAIFKRFNITDPEVKAELHLKLCQKYMREAEDFLAKKDYVQASEKAWGAASQIVKAVAIKRGIELKSHRELWKFTTNLNKEYPDRNLLSMFHVANSLHINFYKDWLTSEAVINGIETIKIFIEKLRSLI